MEQHESTISLTLHQWNGWDVAEQFVIDNGYEPKHTSLVTYIGRVISCYYDDLECYGMTDIELPIREWVRGNWQMNQVVAGYFKSTLYPPYIYYKATLHPVCRQNQRLRAATLKNGTATIKV